MYNPALEAIDSNSTAAGQVDSLLFLIREVQHTYFLTTAPTTADFAKIEDNYRKIQYMFAIFEVIGDRAIEEARKTAAIIRQGAL